MRFSWEIGAWEEKKTVNPLVAVSEEGKWVMTWPIILCYLGQDTYQFWTITPTDLIYELLRHLSEFSPIKDNHLSLGIFLKVINENTEKIGIYASFLNCIWKSSADS